MEWCGHGTFPFSRNAIRNLEPPGSSLLTPSFPGTFIALCGGRTASSSQFHLQILQFVEMERGHLSLVRLRAQHTEGVLSKSLRSQGLKFEEKSFSGDYAVGSDVTDLVVFGLSVRE